MKILKPGQKTTETFGPKKEPTDKGILGFGCNFCCYGCGCNPKPPAN